MKIITLLFCVFAFLFTACTHVPQSPAMPPTTPPSVPANSHDAELSDVVYPYPVQTYEFEAQKQKLKMVYMDVAAPKPNGQTVLLLHGKNFAGAYWKPTIEALTAKGFRVVVPDQIGFGKSSKPAAYQFSFQAFAQNTVALLDQLKIRDVFVVGHSMGGMLATRLTLMYPERVKKLTLVNPIGLEDWKTLTPYRSIDESYAQELKATPDSIREYQKTSYYGGQWKPEYESSIENASGQTKSPDFPRVAWNAALTSDMVFTQPVLYEFPLLRVPTLLIIGQRDRTALGRAWAPEKTKPLMGNYPELGRKAAKAIRGAKLVEIPGVGHLPQVENFPAYIKALEAFLDAR